MDESTPRGAEVVHTDGPWMSPPHGLVLNHKVQSLGIRRSERDACKHAEIMAEMDACELRAKTVIEVAIKAYDEFLAAIAADTARAIAVHEAFLEGLHERRTWRTCVRQLRHRLAAKWWR